jgi:hypothetical protein
VNQSRARRGRPCSGDGGHQRRGPRAGEDSGAYGGPVAPLVEGWGGRKEGSRRGPGMVAARSPSTARFWRSTSAKDLRTRSSESRGTCRYNQLEGFVSDLK